MDSFVILLLIVFLRFNLNNKLTYLNMDFMFFCQWCVIIFLQQIVDLLIYGARDRVGDYERRLGELQETDRMRSFSYQVQYHAIALPFMLQEAV